MCTFSKNLIAEYRLFFEQHLLWTAHLAEVRCFEDQSSDAEDANGSHGG